MQAKLYHRSAFHGASPFALGPGVVSAATSATASATWPARTWELARSCPKPWLLRFFTQFDGPIPVFHRLGVLLEAMVGRPRVPMAVPQEHLGHHGPRLLLVNGPERVDRLLEPRQAIGRFPPPAPGCRSCSNSRRDRLGYSGTAGKSATSFSWMASALRYCSSASARFPRPASRIPRSLWLTASSVVGHGREVGGQLLPDGQPLWYCSSASARFPRPASRIPRLLWLPARSAILGTAGKSAASFSRAASASACSRSPGFRRSRGCRRG